MDGLWLLVHSPWWKKSAIRDTEPLQPMDSAALIDDGR
jgi:hypothetical protein